MQKTLLIIAILASLLLSAALWREPLEFFFDTLQTPTMFVDVDGDDFDPGPALGSHFPGLRATYAGEHFNLLDAFAGANGTALVILRSVDWSPYCRRQLEQLQAQQIEFASAGIGLVAISHDAPDLQQSFTSGHSITLPLLSDIQELSFKTLGILDSNYPPGDKRYGVAYPGMIIIDATGVVRGKLFLKDHRKRVDTTRALDYARTVLSSDRARSNHAAE